MGKYSSEKENQVVTLTSKMQFFIIIVRCHQTPSRNFSIVGSKSFRTDSSYHPVFHEQPHKMFFAIPTPTGSTVLSTKPPMDQT